MRLTPTVHARLVAEAGDEPISSYARRLLETSSGLPMSPPARAQVRAPDDLALAVRVLGSLSGNLQRIYTTVAAGGRADDELLLIKAEISRTSAAVRAAIGCEIDP
ncbi:hypothetical protein GJ654_12440 [Rhodoblastus acidophilus]|uniref:Mobilization protein n=1 Tax=Rhodoblastus acidophilus TaxID=1074 RepID=A0A6N8DSI3_RHOAC|nr:hypothetical protein [Rhodoblastus acidophilus]MCW2275313.1 hypothetical protein [Rhodoblastus acidophilus]MTV31794.1 hypothetical protein [Rhodoblastus acidophilus]